MSKKKKVLITIDWFIPGYKAGGPIQSCANLVAHLKDEFDFFVITRDTDYCEVQPYDKIKSNEWNKLSEGLQVYYFSAQQLTYKNLHEVIWSVKPDVCFINGVYSYYFSVLSLIILKRLGLRRVVVSARGMLAGSAINVKGNKKKLFLAAIKTLRLYRHVTFHATNEGERSDILKVVGATTPVRVAPNLPKVFNSKSNANRQKVAGSLRIVSVARISPEKNLKYALDVLQQFGKTGEVVFDIYGPLYDVHYWEECQDVIQKLPPNVVVTYKQSIASNEVAAILKKYHVLFMPTRGENFGHIILESLCSGCPVVISDQTPWKDLEEVEAGFALPLEKKGNFVAALQNLLHMRQEAYNSWSDNAFKLGQQYVNDKAAVESNRKMFREVS
ncbi:glycosyltransferase family 4 protein [Pontibacter chitinilyticus]|uniref:glycosyltransferase family 4 protein n=1 Tax=Pontibacter chitinilyticus TaxID=2674989 RepID=UPI0032194F7E